MSDRQPKRKRANSEEITDLFRILKNMCRDEEVSDAHFRLAFRISQGRNDDTGWAEASHDLLIDEVPRTQKGKLRGFRDKMRDELGWLRILPGQRGQGTMYQFRDERCAALEAESERKREARHAKSALDRIDRHTALKVAGLGVNSNPSSGSDPARLRGETLPPNGPSSGVNPLPIEGLISTPVLPHSTTSTEGYRKQDEAQDAHVLMPASASVPARADPVRCDCCGDPAMIEARISPSDAFTPYCEECADDMIWLESRPVAAIDPVPDYRRVRDGV